MAAEIAIRIDNRYEVLGELGRGGMGIVYKATDHKMDRVVAIKVMTAHGSGRDEYQERFLREAKSIAKMQHPNIVVVHDYGYHNGSPYMVMEYVEGIPLDKVISSRVALAALTKVDYIVQVCHALHYAHQLKIIHRDVKPGNIMVLEGGKRVKLLDFGIARAAGVSNLSKSGLAMGTSCYMSPEQTRGLKDLDGRADIFSAGVVLYELLAGKPPWTGDSDFDVMTKIVNDPYPPISTVLRSYPPGLDLVFERALAKDARSRYQTAEKMAQELSELEVALKEQALEDALVQFEKGDLLRASELVSQILRVDTRYREALELRGKLQQVVQLHQRTEQVRHLRIAAEQAVGQKRYTDALAAIEQAISLDAANSELFHYRELVRQEVRRREDIRKKLELARRAQEINDLSTAQELVEKALEADPTDTHARMMKSSLEEERKRQQQREMVEDAERALVARAFDRAHELIQQLELLDSAFPLLTSLKKKLAEAEAEEQRRLEIDESIREVRRVLETGDPSQSLAIVEKALARFPGEPRLLRLKNQAEGLRDAAERERSIQEQIAGIKKLADQQQYSEALALAENAVKRFGSEYRLQASVAHLREAVEREGQLRAEQSVLSQAREAIKTGDHDSALKILTSASVELPGSIQIADALRGVQDVITRKAEARLLENARKLEITETLERRLATHLDPEDQVRLAEEAAATISGNETAERVLARVRERQQQIASAVERAGKFEQAENFSESIREWQRVQQLYPDHPQARANVTRLTAALKVDSSAIPQSGPVASRDLSATSIMAAAPSRAPSSIERPPSPVLPEAPQPPASVAESHTKSRLSPKWLLLAGAGALVIVITAISLHFALQPGKRPAPVVTPTPAASPAPTPPPRPVNGTLLVKTGMDKVKVLVDGDLKGVTVGGSATISLVPGNHQISVSKTGYGAPAQQVQITGDSQAELQFKLTTTDETSPAPVETSLIVKSQPGARVLLDKKEIGQVPGDGSYSTRINPGKHHIDVTLDGFKPWSDTIKINAGDTLSLLASLTAIPKPPVFITSFSIASNNIKQGEEVQLSWETENATEVTIDHGVGTVPPKGSTSVKPGAHTIYTLIAKGEGSPQQRSVSVDVTEPPPPKVGIFVAAPDTIQQGKPGSLVWSTQNAVEAYISPELGKVDLSGNKEVHPNATTTYTLTVKGAGGVEIKTTTQIKVEAAPPPPPPPANVASSTSAPVVPVRSDDADVKAVTETIQIRYKTAIQSRLISEVKKVWLNMPKDAENQLKAGFDDQDVKSELAEFDCNLPKINGDAAELACRQTITFNIDKQLNSTKPVTIVFQLRKIEGTWKIVASHIGK